MTKQEKRISRRDVFGVLSLALTAPVLVGWTKSRELQFGADPNAMEPGDYTWNPERGRGGDIMSIVSLPEQRVYVYRGGDLIAVSTCSTGRKGHRTPTGVFTVLQKDKDHVSSTYKGAKMPYMERLTWSGIALHAGNLPGYPASHGCIRLPLAFAQKLFSISHLGMVIILADQHSEPTEVVHPGIFLPAHAEEEAQQHAAAVANKKRPPKARHEAPQRPAKVLISVADKSITVFEDGHIRTKGPAYVASAGGPIGNHTFVLKSAHDNGRTLVWTAVGHHADGPDGRLAKVELSVLNRITTDDRTSHAIQSVMHPGLVMHVTDDAAPETTRSGRSFVIATHHEPEDWRTDVFRN